MPVGFHKVPVGPFPCPVLVPLDGSPALWHTSCVPWFAVIHILDLKTKLSLSRKINKSKHQWPLFILHAIPLIFLNLARSFFRNVLQGQFSLSLRKFTSLQTFPAFVFSSERTYPSSFFRSCIPAGSQLSSVKNRKANKYYIPPYHHHFRMK